MSQRQHKMLKTSHARQFHYLLSTHVVK